MKQSVRSTVLALVGLLLLVASASAQSDHIVANVPFSFRVGDVLLPAARYDILPSGAQSVLILRGGGQQRLMAVGAAENVTPSKNTKLVFNRYGSSYFLTQIWVEGNSRGSQLPKTQMEKEIARGAVRSPEVILAERK
jgi:hypothetical protein